MKTFKKFVKEETLDEATFMTTMATLQDPNPNPGDYSDPKVVKALNSFVGTVTRATHHGTMIPEHVIAKMRNSLSKVGLSFDEVPMLEGASGSFELPLTSYGGRFGKGVNTPHNEFESDDGISHMVEGGLTLVLAYTMLEDNSYKLNASIK
jgi:hypothetical protein|tara:strand:- start:2672 stop:3124 length:453 start_codon:yes stop_codon:yes gene_type:complete